METEISLNKELTLLKELLKLENVPLDAPVNEQLDFIFEKISLSTNSEIYSAAQIQPILMRLFLLFDSKKFFTTEYFPKFIQKIKVLTEDFISKSSLSTKYFTQLKMFFSKKKFSKFSNLFKFLYQFELARTSYSEVIGKEVLKDVEGLEKKQEYLATGLVNYLSKEVIVTNIIPFLLKLIRKSMKNVSKIRLWIKKLNPSCISPNSNIHHLSLVMDSKIPDIINKDESFQKEFFNISEILFKNFSGCFSKDEEIEKAAIKYLSNMNSKFKSKRNDVLMVRLSNLVSMIKGKQSEKIVKEIVDTHWITFNNIKAEEERQLVVKNFNNLLEIDNDEALIKNLSAKLKDKKLVGIAGELLFHLTQKMNLNHLEVSDQNGKLVYSLKNSKFDSIQDLNKNFVENWKLFGDLAGKEAVSVIESTADSVPVNLVNISLLLYNSYFCLLNETNSELISSFEDENSDFTERKLQNYKNGEKIIKLLFKSNSLLFRKSFTENLSPLSSFVLLKILNSLNNITKSHIQDIKCQSNYILLVYSLIKKVLLSEYSEKLNLNKKVKKLLEQMNKTKNLKILQKLNKEYGNSLVFSTNLVNDHFVQIFIEGSFIHMTGKKYSLEQHKTTQKFLNLCLEEKKNIFEICKNSEKFGNSDISLKLQLITVLSLSKYENEVIPSLKSLKKVNQTENDENIETILDTLTNNQSRFLSHKDSSSVLLGELNDLFNGDLDNKLDLFLNKLCTNLGLFESNENISIFMGNLLSMLLLHNSKLILQRINWLLSNNNLSKLNRMNKILKLIEMTDLEFEKEEETKNEDISVNIYFLLTSLGNISKSHDDLKAFGFSDISDLKKSAEEMEYPDLSTFENEKEDLFEKCAELHNFENEEEEMNELELNSQKKDIISKYSNIIHQLDNLMKNLVNKSILLEENEKSNISEDFIQIQNSVKKIIEEEDNYMKSICDSLFLNILSLTCLKNNVSEILSHYYNILTGNEDSIFMVKVEKTAESLKVENSFFSDHLFQIFFKVLEFVVEFNLSAQAKKNLLEIVVKFTTHFDKYSDTVYEYIANNLNSFYFDLSFNKIEEMLLLNMENESGMNHLDVLCNNLIMYEEYAREQVLKIIFKNIDSIKSKYKQQVSPLNKLKLMFLSEDEDSGSTEIATKIIEINTLKFDINSFSELSFDDMMLEFPNDTQETFAEIFKDLYNKLNGAEKKLFLNKICESLKKISNDKEYCNLTKKEFENRLILIPKIISQIQQDIKGALFCQLFEIFNLIEKNDLPILSEFCISLGQEMISQNPSDLGKLIASQLGQIDPKSPLLSPIIFVAECARINPNLSSQISNLQDDLERLLDVDNKLFLTNLAKNLRHLLTFIKSPQEMLQNLFESVIKNKAKKRLVGTSYFISGLLKGLGIRHFKEFKIISKMNEIFEKSTKRDYKDIDEEVRYGCVLVIESLWDVFERLIEPSIRSLMNFLLKFLGDKSERIRELTMSTMRKIMNRISEFGIKQIVPVIMKGTQDKNSKTKYNSILALGSIANCGTKQLSQNLPLIVPQLTEATNDTNDQVNSAAKKSLSMILETIKSPEVSQMRDILIQSLSDPFSKNDKSLDALLKTTFKHALDGSSLSLIVPIALYGCKTINTDESKIKSAQLIATMIHLVPKPEDFLPHLQSLLDALSQNLKSISPEVRAVTSKAFGALCKKFKNETGMKLLNELKNVLEDESVNSTERTGFAQAFAEVINALGDEVTSIFIPKSLELTKDSREHIRESFLSLFVYLPMVMKSNFVKYIRETIETVVESISHEKEKIRNLAIKSLKIIILNYLQDDFQVLLKPLFEGSLSKNINKKNSSLILLGDIIQMLVDDVNLTNEVIYTNYSRIFSLFYIIKNDDNAEVRETSKNIYKTFIPNTQKCLRIIFEDLHECFIELFSREQEEVQLLARNGLKEFGNKFSDSFAIQMLELSSSILKDRKKRYSEILNNPNWKSENTLKREVSKIETLLSGQSKFISEFISNCNNHALRKIKNSGIVQINDELCEFTKKKVWMSAFEGLRTFVERENETSIIVEKLRTYSETLNKIENERTLDENEELYEKCKSLFTVLLQSEKESIIKETSSFIFDGTFSEWKFEVIIQNIKLFGNYLYSYGPLKSGLKDFFECYESVLNNSEMDSTKKQEFLENNKFTINTLSVNVNPDNVEELLTEFFERTSKYTDEKSTEMIVLMLDSLKYFFERYVMDEIEFPYNICSVSLKLISYSGDRKEYIYLQTGEFLEVLFRFFDRENCYQVMDETFTTLQEIVKNNEEYEGLKNPKVIQCLFNLINVVLNYSTLNSAMTALKTSKFMIDELSLELLEPHKKEFYASILRLWIFKYVQRNSEPEFDMKRLFSFLNTMLDKKLDMGFLKTQYTNYLIMMINSEKKKEIKNQEQKNEANKESKSEPLMIIYMKYLLNLNLYFGTLIQIISNWDRRVKYDSSYYEQKALDDFVHLINCQTEEKVSTNLKTKIESLLKVD